jgi:serine/threonine protein kinase
VDSSAIQGRETVGTPGYVSPEVIERRPHGSPVDMWAMGVVLYMLLGGYPPFYEPDDNQKAMYRRILAASYEFHPENWSEVSAEAKDLIRKLLVVNPNDRLTAAQALQHPWLAKPREELALVSLQRTIMSLKDYRSNRAKQGAALAAVAIDAMRKISGANLVKPGSLNDVAIDVMRQLSGTNLNEAVIEAARKRSGMNLKVVSERIEANRTRSGANVRPSFTGSAPNSNKA